MVENMKNSFSDKKNSGYQKQKREKKATIKGGGAEGREVERKSSNTLVIMRMQIKVTM